MPKSCSSHDRYQRRCPRLGHLVGFGYCRVGDDDGHPCFKVFDCWWEQFDVVAFFRQSLSKEAFDKLRCAKPPDKVASLLTLIRQARDRTGHQDPEK